MFTSEPNINADNVTYARFHIKGRITKRNENLHDSQVIGHNTFHLEFSSNNL